jgi:hypothetical protein
LDVTDSNHCAHGEDQFEHGWFHENHCSDCVCLFFTALWLLSEKNMPESNSLKWVNIATLPSNDRESKEAITKILDKENIKNGLHGSRVHALSVHPGNEVKAREIFKDEVLKIKGARMWSSQSNMNNGKGQD